MSKIYRSWDEAMDDPDLDLSRLWFVAPDVDLATEGEPFEWPEGWINFELLGVAAETITDGHVSQDLDPSP